MASHTAPSLSIPRRFRGPPESANGGYTCGLLGTALGGCAEVTLKKPPPLERALHISGAEVLSLLDGEQVVAEARRAELDLSVPDCPSFADAEQCATRYSGFETHIYPECFVCGPARAEGDGLRIFAGRESSEALVAAPFVPDASLTNAEGLVEPAFVWAALDCPAYFALGETFVAVLGRMTASVEGTLRAGQRCVVIGWKLGNEGRKYHAGTALFTEDGELVGRSKQTWIRL
jgi:hypothetical protein